MKDAKLGIERGELAENVLIIQTMPTESWTKYKYLFARDLDDKDWDAIEDFYNKCKLYDEALKHSNSMFQKNEEQIRINLAKFLSDYAIKNPVQMTKIGSNEEEKKKWQKLIDITDNYQNMIITRSAIYMYKPQKPINDAKLYLSNIDLNILQSNVAKKLKGLAHRTT